MSKSPGFTVEHLKHIVIGEQLTLDERRSCSQLVLEWLETIDVLGVPIHESDILYWAYLAVRRLVSDSDETIARRSASITHRIYLELARRTSVESGLDPFDLLLEHGMHLLTHFPAGDEARRKEAIDVLTRASHQSPSVPAQAAEALSEELRIRDDCGVAHEILDRVERSLRVALLRIIAARRRLYESMGVSVDE